MPYLIIPLLALTAGLTIYGDTKGMRRVFFVFKPTSTLLILAVVLLGLTQPHVDRSYALALALGLLFSLAGDVALMFAGSRPFLIGMVLFLLAQVTYALTFAVKGGLHGPLGAYAFLLAAIALAFYVAIFRRLGKMKIPVGIYALAISAMLWTAISTRFSPAFAATQSWLVISGAALFYVSDLLLSVNRFARPIKHYRLANLSTYYVGQLLIALSVWFGTS
jgi:alkenylglycerophosphocholine/alkenylglycerophosphoethanolamine hydrolase